MFTDKNINFAPYNKTKSFINQTITYIDMADEQVKKYIDKAKNEMESSVVFLDESKLSTEELMLLNCGVGEDS